MPQDTTYSVGANWTLVTTNDCTKITIQNLGARAIFIKGTNGTTPPAESATGIRLDPKFGESATLADLFPGTSGVNRVWVKGQRSMPCLVLVMHD
jgi:hypothetical protein